MDRGGFKHADDGGVGISLAAAAAMGGERERNQRLGASRRLGGFCISHTPLSAPATTYPSMHVGGSWERGAERACDLLDLPQHICRRRVSSEWRTATAARACWGGELDTSMTSKRDRTEEIVL